MKQLAAVVLALLLTGCGTKLGGDSALVTGAEGTYAGTLTSDDGNDYNVTVSLNQTANGHVSVITLPPQDRFTTPCTVSRSYRVECYDALGDTFTVNWFGDVVDRTWTGTFVFNASGDGNVGLAGTFEVTED